jgi:hypothetical protein
VKTNIQRFLLAALMLTMGVGCSTVYDPYGYPHTVVEPEGAILGAAAAGLIGYGLGRSYDHGYHHHHHHGYHGYYY